MAKVVGFKMDPSYITVQLLDIYPKEQTVIVSVNSLLKPEQLTEVERVLYGK